MLELVRAEGGDKRFVARTAAYAVNATGLAVMIAVFASTAFIPTGLELATGAGTTVAAQAVLQAIFGDQAVRTLAAKARTDLLDRVRTLLDAEADRFLSRTARRPPRRGRRRRRCAGPPAGSSWPGTAAACPPPATPAGADEEGSGDATSPAGYARRSAVTSGSTPTR